VSLKKSDNLTDEHEMSNEPKYDDNQRIVNLVVSTDNSNKKEGMLATFNPSFIESKTNINKIESSDTLISQKKVNNARAKSIYLNNYQFKTFENLLLQEQDF
jgi:hypothetical protein